MKLTWNGFRFEIHGYPAFKDQFKQAGFHFDWKGKVWWSGLVEVARQFQHLADADAAKKLSAYQREVDLSRATTSNLVIPAPEGMEYLPFQKAGIEYAAPRKHTLIADEQGLGKTIQAIGVINAVPAIKNILIVCPAGLVLNWGRELQRWVVGKLSGDFASSTTLPNSNIVIANYEIMHKLKDKVMARDWDLHIYDESHYMKNPDALRTKAVLGHEDTREAKNCRPIEAKKKIWMTGTPILNRPVELWPMLRVADPENLGCSFWLFAKKFCGAEDSTWGRTFDGASNLDILQDRLRSSLMIRRLKRDVLSELPPKRRQIIAIEAPASVRGIVKKELEFYSNNTNAIEEAMKRAEVAQASADQVSYESAAKDLKGLRQAMFEELSRLRHDTAVAKVPFIIDYLTNALEQQEKIVVFAHHQDVIRPIVEKFNSIAVKFDGTMSATQKQQSVDLFQNDKQVKLFVGSVTAAGVGITLTAASHVVFCELDWRPAMVTQAEDRCHRIGQKDAVNVYHIVFDASLDSNMVKRIVEKQQIIDSAIGG